MLHKKCSRALEWDNGLITLLMEQIDRLSEENAKLRDALAARLGAQAPYPPVKETLPPRRVYTDDGIVSVQVEDEE